MGLIITDTRMPSQTERAPMMPMENYLSPKLPSFYEWRNPNHVSMAPDKGFDRQLKKLNKDYYCVWDWGSSKWEIWSLSLSRVPYHVLTVETKDKTYRELGTDILLKLSENILFNESNSADQIADYLDELDNQVQRRKEKALRNIIADITNDTFNYVHNVLQVQVPRSLKIERVVKDG